MAVLQWYIHRHGFILMSYLHPWQLGFTGYVWDRTTHNEELRPYGPTTTCHVTARPVHVSSRLDGPHDLFLSTYRPPFGAVSLSYQRLRGQLRLGDPGPVPEIWVFGSLGLCVCERDTYGTLVLLLPNVPTSQHPNESKGHTPSRLFYHQSTARKATPTLLPRS